MIKEIVLGLCLVTATTAITAIDNLRVFVGTNPVSFVQHDGKVFVSVADLAAARVISYKLDKTTNTLVLVGTQSGLIGERTSRVIASGIPATVGSVVGSVTWQYNNYVGTKGDNGATACLIPSPVKKVAAADSGHSFAYYPAYATEYHWICKTVGGDGVVNFDSVPVGTYFPLMVSHNTIRDRVPARPDERNLLGLFFDGDAAVDAALSGPLILYKWAFESDVNVTPNGTSHFSHDFGNTY